MKIHSILFIIACLNVLITRPFPIFDKYDGASKHPIQIGYMTYMQRYTELWQQLTTEKKLSQKEQLELITHAENQLNQINSMHLQDRGTCKSYITIFITNWGLDARYTQLQQYRETLLNQTPLPTHPCGKMPLCSYDKKFTDLFEQIKTMINPKNPSPIYKEDALTLIAKTEKLLHKSTISTNLEEYNAILIQLHTLRTQVLDRSETMACPLCLEETEPFALSCGHTFCQQCLHDAIDIALHDKSTLQLKCYTCKHPFSDKDLSRIAHNNVKKLALLSSIKLGETRNIHPCPTIDCKGYYLKNAHAKNYECVLCKKTYCAHCALMHNSEKTCAQAQQEKAAREESENASRQWTLENTKKCPNCQKSIEKNAGCAHIHCDPEAKGCNDHFCWHCLTPWIGYEAHRCPPAPYGQPRAVVNTLQIGKIDDPLLIEDKYIREITCAFTMRFQNNSSGKQFLNLFFLSLIGHPHIINTYKKHETNEICGEAHLTIQYDAGIANPNLHILAQEELQKELDVINAKYLK